MSSPSFDLAGGLHESSLSMEQLWLEYLALGGEAGPIEVEAYVLGVLEPDSYQHNVIAQAINEQFVAAGGNHPVAYRD